MSRKRSQKKAARAFSDMNRTKVGILERSFYEIPENAEPQNRKERRAKAKLARGAK